MSQLFTNEIKECLQPKPCDNLVTPKLFLKLSDNLAKKDLHSY